MLLNVYRQRPAVLPGTRLLASTLGLIGHVLLDPLEPARAWVVQGFYEPLPGRALGGLRVRLTDTQQFVTFCNQRDFEVLLGVAVPGQNCPWAQDTYVAPGERAWCGLCCDDDDLVDDLHERELLLRASAPGPSLAHVQELERRVHLDAGRDIEETLVFLGDRDPHTGLGPDPRFATVTRRWASAERRRVRWTSL